MSDEKEKARMRLEDAVWAALEAGMTAVEIENEVKYALESTDD